MLLHTSLPTYAHSTNGRRFSRAFLGLGLLVLLIGLAGASRLPSRLEPPSSSLSFAVLPQLKERFKIKKTPPAQPPAAETIKETVRVVSEESQVIEVVKRASDAVVSIIASADVPRVVQCRQQVPIEGLPQEFRGFFEVPTLCQQGTERKRIGAGSGFLVSADGYVVTNKHVVSNERGEYTVVLNDKKHEGQKLKARVLARDPNNDIALLKVAASDLPFLPFGDSQKLQVGQTAIAIGYALGEFDNTVSKGVVSGLFRSIQASGGGVSEQLRGLIQTDAAINPGNSGGPLLDIAGNVIGMNTAVANAQSIGFAIPVNEIKAAYDQVRSNGTIAQKELAFIGVRYAAITPELKDTNKLPLDNGMLLLRGPNNEPAVVSGSPGDKAGLKEGDIILEADGRGLSERYLLSDAVANRKPNEIIELKVHRQGVVHNLRVTLEKKS